MIAALRRFWVVIAAFTAIALVIAIAAATLPETKYEARATLLAQPDAERVDFAAVEAVRFLLPSLAQLVSTNTFRGQVGERFDPALPASRVDAKAEFEPGTGIVHVTGTDVDPARAQQIAQVAAVLLGQQQLSAAVEIRVLDAPELPTSEAGPGTGAYLVGGLVLGLLGGVLTAIVLAAAERSRRHQDAAQGVDRAEPFEPAQPTRPAQRARPAEPAETVQPAKPIERAEPAKEAELLDDSPRSQPGWTSLEPAATLRRAAPQPQEAAGASAEAGPPGEALESAPDPGSALDRQLEQLQVAVLGSIPVKSQALAASQNGSGSFDAAFRSLAETLAAHARSQPHLLISSARAGAGRSTVTANLAWALASAGSTAVAVDADADNPMLHRFLRVPNDVGLARVDEVGIERATQATALPGLKVIPSGVVDAPEAPTTHTTVARVLDELEGVLTIIDGPSVLESDGVGDVARATGAVVLVVDASDARAGEELAESVATMKKLGVHVVGAVLNRVSP